MKTSSGREQANEAAELSVDALAVRGKQACVDGRLEEGIALFRQCIALDPDRASAHYNLGTALAETKQWQAAVEAYHRAIAADPKYVNALYNRANAWGFLGQVERALADYLHYLVERPRDPDGYARLAELLEMPIRGEDSWGDIVEACARRVERTRANLDALNRCGLVLTKLHRYKAAEALYEELLELDPDNADLHCNSAYPLMAQTQLGKGLARYHHAIALAPDNAYANFYKGICHLLRGEYAAGWRSYEWRWKLPGARPMRTFGKPRWLGLEDIRGKTILLHPEQGLGDLIQFGRYARLVAERGARVILEMPSVLFEAMRGVDGVDELVEYGDELPPFDCHCPLMSLPLALGTTLSAIPEPSYLRVDEGRRKEWEKKLGPSSRLRVGVVWSGNAKYDNDFNRSTPLATLGPLLALPIEFHALQVDLRPEDTDALAAAANLRWHGAEALKNFADTAALIDAMDCVISVDTAAAHLAGSLGKPVWILLPFCPDFRWMLYRSDSPWYPTARLFRQTTPGDWKEVVERVAQALCAEDFGISPIPTPALPLKGREVENCSSPLKGREEENCSSPFKGEVGRGMGNAPCN